MMFGAAPKSSVWASSALLLITTAALMAVVMTAPPTSSDDQLGSSASRMYYRNPESIPSSEDNIIPLSLEAGPQIPNLYDPQFMNFQPSSENAILASLLGKRLRLMGNSRFRSYLNGMDTTSNEISRKRSYSKYCAFNAVSCFGK